MDKTTQLSLELHGFMVWFSHPSSFGDTQETFSGRELYDSYCKCVFKQDVLGKENPIDMPLIGYRKFIGILDKYILVGILQLERVENSTILTYRRYGKEPLFPDPTFNRVREYYRTLCFKEEREVGIG